MLQAVSGCCWCHHDTAIWAGEGGSALGVGEVSRGGSSVPIRRFENDGLFPRRARVVHQKSSANADPCRNSKAENNSK
jgi:hypothetical protein